MTAWSRRSALPPAPKSAASALFERRFRFRPDGFEPVFRHAAWGGLVFFQGNFSWEFSLGVVFRGKETRRQPWGTFGRRTVRILEKRPEGLSDHDS